MKYQRDKLGILDFQGMNLVRAVDMMPPNKFPFAQNVRRYVQGGIMSRSRQNNPVMTLTGGSVHTIRRMNDTTPQEGTTSGGGPAPGSGTFSLSPPVLNFGTVPQNTLAQLLIEITFTGTGPATLNSVSLSNSQFQLLGMPGLPYTFSNGTFTGWYVGLNQPAGSYSAVMTIVTSVGTLTVQVSGTTVAANLSVSPAQLAFPNTVVGVTTAPMSIVLTNNEPNAVELGGYSIDSAPFTPSTAFAFAPVPPFPMTIAPGQSLTFNLVATPQVAGSNQATLTILTNVTGVQVQVGLVVVGLFRRSAADAGTQAQSPRQGGGPASGYVLIAGAGPNLWLTDGSSAATEIDTGYSGSPLSLLPFRPNASVQPWMYIGDRAKMTKVRSDQTVYKMGIKEPQAPPAVTQIPASDVISLLGNVTVYFYNNPGSAHNPPLQGIYLPHNPADKGPTTLMQTAEDANGSNEGNSLRFDYTSSGASTGSPSNEVQWYRYDSFVGTVSTSGTLVSWDSGDQFLGLVSGDTIVISGVTYTITGTPTNTTLTLTASAGNQVAVNYTAAKINGTVPLFSPPMESEGFSDFNCAILGTFYVPKAGTYSFMVQAKDDFMWGIGNCPNGTVSWPALTGTQSYSSYGQSMTTINGFALIPRQHETSGENNFYSSITINITFSAPGNYPFEVDWDYWYHIPRGLMVQINGADIPPVPPSAITNAQYIYTYRSSATGAVSNGSPASQQSPLSALANTVAALFSSDPQVDKIDFYRLDEGLSNYTYVGTIPNQAATTTLQGAVPATGVPVQIPVTSLVGITAGTVLSIAGGAETVTVISTGVSSPTITAVFQHTYPGGTAAVAIGGQLLDDLLDTDVAANPLLQYDNFEPFPVIDLPHKGIVNVVNGVVNLVSGDDFDIRWLPGTIIIVATIAYTLNTRPTSTTTLTCQNMEVVNGIETVVTPPNGISFPYEISEPTLAAQPLPYMWGPTDNVAFAFGCGDAINPGTLYWSKGNNLDAAPDSNQQNVTSPSEPLQNGCIVNGMGMVYSPERAWLIWPNYFNALATVTGTVGQVWTLQVSVSLRGLYIPRALAVDGGGNVFFRAKDGLYIAPGGSGSRSITDDDLFNLFPHEGRNPKPVHIGNTGHIVYPPNDSLPDQQKLSCANGYLYYDYVDASGTPRTLTFDIAAGGWVWDVYQAPVTVHQLEEGPNINDPLVGCADGTVRRLSESGPETGIADICLPANDAGDVRAMKQWGDIYLEVEVQS